MFFGSTIFVWPYFLASFIALGLVFNVKSRRKSATATYFKLGMLAATVWSLASGIHLQASGFDATTFWANAKFLGIAPLPVLWLLLAVTYSNEQVDIKPKHLIALFLIPVVTIFLVSTNSFHNLVFGPSSPIEIGNYTSVARENGPWFWVHASYSYAVFLIGVYFFIRHIAHSKGHLQAQAQIMLAGSLLPFLFTTIHLMDSSLLLVDYTPVAFTATGIVYFFGLFKFNLLDLLPIAREEIIRSIEDVVIVTDLSGVIVDTNDAAVQLRKRTEKSEVGQLLKEEFPFLSKFWEEAGTVDKCRNEIEITHNGVTSWYRVDMKNIERKSGKVSGRLIVMRDINVKKLAEIQLQDAKQKAEELSRLKSAFLASMSHDVRTPLAGIIGLADVLVEECKGDQQQFAEMILDSGNRLLKLVNSLLSVSHLSTGTLDFSTEIINLHSLSQDLIENTEKELKDKTVDLFFSLPSNVIQVRHDPNHLIHALTHILDHAVRFTDEGSIQFDLRKEQNEAVFRISDTGRGFEPDFVRSIGERLDEKALAEVGTTNKSGLGLRVANGLIEEMGGRLLFTSEVGVGSTYAVRLPMTCDLVTPLPTVQDRPAAERPSTKVVQSNPNPADSK